MLIELRKLEDGKVDFDHVVEPPDVDLSARFSSLIEPSRFRGILRKEDWFAIVSGYFKAVTERICDRCLSKCRVTQEVTVDRAYVEFKKLDEEREIQLDVRRVEYSLIESGQVDLLQVFEEHLLLAIPDNFVCEDGCAGICQECGLNKNSAECVCDKKVADPRWAALKEIKKELE